MKNSKHREEQTTDRLKMHYQTLALVEALSYDLEDMSYIATLSQCVSKPVNQWTGLPEDVQIPLHAP